MEPWVALIIEEHKAREAFRASMKRLAHLERIRGMSPHQLSFMTPEIIREAFGDNP